MRCCGNGGWRFRSYSGSLLANAEHGGLVADLSGRSSTATHFCLKHRDPNVGAGLPANAVCQSAHVSLTHRLREQARSHNLTEFICQHRSALLFCGSWLACDADNSMYQA